MPVIFGDSVEPVVACVDLHGHVQWLYTGLNIGASVGADVVEDVSHHRESGLVAVLTTSGSSSWGDKHRSTAVLAVGVASTHGLAPKNWTRVRFGGEFIKAIGVSVHTVEGGVLISGGFMRNDADTTGVMWIPDFVACSHDQHNTATGGVTLAPPHTDKTTAWLAFYSVTVVSGECVHVSLLWAALGYAQSDRLPLVRPLQLRAVTPSSFGATLCASFDSSGASVVVWKTSPSIADIPPQSPAVLSANTTGSMVDAPADVLTASGLVSVVAAINTRTGALDWTQWVYATGGEARCSSIAATHARAVVVGTASSTAATPSISVSGHTADFTLELADRGDEGLPLTKWVAELDLSSGAPQFLRGIESQTQLAPSSHDMASVVLVDEHDDMVYVIGSSRALQHTVRGPTAAGLLVGASGSTSRSAVGSWDVWGAELRLSATRGPGAVYQKPVQRAVAVTLGGATGEVEGFISGVSGGATTLIAVGGFKGELVLDNLHTLTAAGDSGNPDHGYDAVAVVYKASSDAASPVVVRTLRIKSFSQPWQDERFTAACASPLGDLHFLVGYTTPSSSYSSITFDEYATSLPTPGDGGRDGFLVALRDDDHTVAWQHSLGAIGGRDDAILAVAAGNDIVAAGGYFTGSGPSWGYQTLALGLHEKQEAMALYVASTNTGEASFGLAVPAPNYLHSVRVTSIAIFVASDGSTQGIVCGGFFTAGALTLGGNILHAVSSYGRTGFVAYVSLASQSFMWAHAIVPDASLVDDAHSMVTGAAVLRRSLVLSGEFWIPGAAKVCLNNVRCENKLQHMTTTDKTRAIVAVLDVETGDTHSITIPQCDEGCTSHGVAVAGGQAWVALSFNMSLRMSRHSLQVASPHQQLAVAVIDGPGGSDVVALRHISAGVATASVQTMAMTAHRDDVVLMGSTTAGVTFPRTHSGSWQEMHGVPAPTRPTGEPVSVPARPMFARFDAAQSPKQPLSSAHAARVVVVAQGQGGQATDMVSEVVTDSISTAMSRHSVVTAVTITNGTLVEATSRTPLVDNMLSGTFGSHGHGTHHGAAMLVTDRVSGSVMSMTAFPNVSNSRIVAATASPDGTMYCVAGTVDDASDAASWPHGWATSSGGDSGGGGDAFVACFSDASASVVPHRFAVLDSTAEEEAAAAAAMSNHAVYITTLRTFDGDGLVPLGVSDSSMPDSPVYGREAALYRQPLYTSSDATQLLKFGNPYIHGNLVRVSAVAVTANDSMICVAGAFFGYTMDLGAGSGRSVQRPDDATQAVPFVACYTMNVAADDFVALILAWFSQAEPQSGLDMSTLPHPAVTSLLFDSTSQMLFMTGLHADDSLSWGSTTSYGPATSATASPSERSQTTAYVAAFDPRSATASPCCAHPALWVRQVSSTTRGGLREITSSVVMAEGRVCVVVGSSSPLLISSTKAPIAPVSVGAAPSSFAAFLCFDVASGLALSGVTLADPQPRPAKASQVARLSVAFASTRDVSLVGDAADVVVAGAMRGRLRSSLQRHHDATFDATTSSAIGAHRDAAPWAVFHAPMPGACAAGSGAHAVYQDGSVVEQMPGIDAVFDMTTPPSSTHIPTTTPRATPPRYVVQLEVWSSEEGMAIIGGSWQHSRGPSHGVRFAMDIAHVNAQRRRHQTWVLVEADAFVMDDLGLEGGAQSRRSLRYLRLVTTGTVDPLAQFRVRRIRLVPRNSDCVPCGRVSVQEAHTVDLVLPPWSGSTDSEGATAGLSVDHVNTMVLRPYPRSTASSLSVAAVPVDATTLVDPTCNCLRDTDLVWEQQDVPLAPNASTQNAHVDVHVTGVEITVPTREAGAFSTTVVPGPATRHGWRTMTASIALSDHVRANDVDWRQVTSVHLLARLENRNGTHSATKLRHSSQLGSLPQPIIRVRGMYLRRQCQIADSALHPVPQEDVSVILGRSGLSGMVRGDTYRAIAFETNMRGEDGPATCSAPFVADDTPPFAPGAVAVWNVAASAVPTASANVSFTRWASLALGWDATFSEPDSAPDNVLLYRIANVRTGSPEGPLVVEDTVARASFETKRLPISNNDQIVFTSPLPLQDGEQYFASLDVCNRGQLCSQFAAPGVVFDASPPLSAWQRFVPALNDTAAEVHASSSAPTAFHQRLQTALRAEWAEFYDPHTSVLELRVGLGTRDDGTDVHEFVVVPPNTTSFTFGPPEGSSQFITGQPYFVVLRATNPARAVSLTRIGPMYIDATPPVVQWVVDVFPLDDTGVETHYRDNATALGDVDTTDAMIVRAKFRCSDPESVAGMGHGLMQYAWRVCTTSTCEVTTGNGTNSTAVTEWMDVGTIGRGATERGALHAVQDEARRMDKSLVLFSQVMCTNPVGLSSFGVSDGMVLDTTPADNSTAVVADLNPAYATLGMTHPVLDDVDWLPSSALAASWTGFRVDPGRPALLAYQVGVGSEPGLDDVAPFKNVGLATFADNLVANDTIRQAEVVFVTVRAVTAAGAVSSITSNGVGVDGTVPMPLVLDSPPIAGSEADPRQCASHLRCMELSENKTASASATFISFTVARPAKNVAPWTRLRYGASTCDSLDTVLDLNILALTTAKSPNQTSFAVSEGVSMIHGARICAVAFATSDTGVTGYGASPGFIVDLTPPVAAFIHEGASAHVDEDAITSFDTLTVTLQCHDVESGIHHAAVQVLRVDPVTGAPLAVVHNWSSITGSHSPPGTRSQVQTATVHNLTLEEGHRYVSVLRCVSGSGAYVDKHSDGFVVDLSPPDTRGAVIDHSLTHISVSVQPERHSILASWRGFVDAGSRVVGFAWSVGTHPHGVDVVPVTDVGPLSSVSAHNLSLVDGQTYFVTVYATNGAGGTASAVSAGVTVDASAPSPSSDIVVHNATHDGSVMWVGSANAVQLSWSPATDMHSNISHYRWALGTQPFGVQVRAWTVVPSSRVTAEHRVHVHVNELHLLSGMTYFASVEAVNGGGLKSFAHTSAFRVDPLPPNPGSVFVVTQPNNTNPFGSDGADEETTPRPSSWLHRRYTSNTRALGCAWSNFHDPLSGVSSFRVGLGTQPGTADLTGGFVTLASNVSTWFVDGLALLSGQSVFCSVKAVNHAGHVSSVSSPATVIDTSPPWSDVGVWGVDPIGLVRGSVGAMDASSRPSVLPHSTAVAASWSMWRDGESGIARIMWAVGTNPGGDDVMAWKTVPVWRTHAWMRIGSRVRPGDKLYYSVRAENRARIVATATSAPVWVLPRPQDTSPLMRIESARVVFIPAMSLSTTLSMEVPVYANRTMFPEPDTLGSTWCHCGDAAGAQMESGAVFDPVAHACTCGPDTYLDPDSLLCVPCPAHTCKTGLGNAPQLCTREACGRSSVSIPTPPPPLSSLITCVDDFNPTMPVRVALDSNAGEVCVCPPGTQDPLNKDLECPSCPAGTVSAALSIIEPARCSACWAPKIPDTVLSVRWSTTADCILASTMSANHSSACNSSFAPPEDADTAMIMSIGTSPGALRWSRRLPGNVTAFQASVLDLFQGVSLPFHQGSVLYVRAQAEVNGLIVGEARSSVTVNYRPPTTGVVFDGGRVNDAEVLPTGAVLKASWHRFGASSGISTLAPLPTGDLQYQVAFGSDGPYSTDLVPWTFVGANTSASFDLEAEVPDGTRVHASVRASFSSGLGWTQASSDGATVQSQIPVGRVSVVDAQTPVAHLNGADALHSWVQLDATTVAAVWDFGGGGGDANTTNTTSHSAVPLRYVWSVVDVDGEDGPHTAVSPAMSTGHRRWGVAASGDEALAALVTAAPLEGRALLRPLVPGHAIQVIVVAFNAANVSRVAVSPPTIVQGALAAPSRVGLRRVSATGTPELVAEFTQPNTTLSHVVFQSNSSAMDVWWVCGNETKSTQEALTTSTVGVVVGSVSGGDQGMLSVAGVVEPIEVPSDPTQHVNSAVITGLNLKHGHCYHAAVSCRSTKLASKRLNSPPLCVDTTAPFASIRVHTPLAVFNRQMAATSNATEILQHRVEFIIAASGPTWSPAIDPDHARVAATPLFQAATDALSSHRGAGKVVVSNRERVVAVHVSALDRESGIQHAEVVWSTFSGTGLPVNVSVQQYEDALMEGAFSSTLPVNVSDAEIHGVAVVTFGEEDPNEGSPWNMVSHEPVYAHVRVVNGAGLVARAVLSVPLFLTQAPWPTGRGQHVEVNHFQADTTSLHAAWSFAGPEAGLVGVVWSVHSDSDGTFVVPPTWLGVASEVTATGLQLSPDEKYVVRVSPCGLGLACKTYSSHVTIDVSPPTAGVITATRGWQWPPPLENACRVTPQGGHVCDPVPPPQLFPGGTDAKEKLLAAGWIVHWGGFTDEESHVNKYQVALGTSPGGTQLMGYLYRTSSTSMELWPLLGADRDVVARFASHGAVLFVTVTAVNGAGLSTSVAMPVFVADEAAPAPGKVTFAETTPMALPGSVGEPFDQASATNSTSLWPSRTRFVQTVSDRVTVQWTPFDSPQLVTTSAEDDGTDGNLTVADSLANPDTAFDAAVEYDVSLVLASSGEVVSAPLTVEVGADARNTTLWNATLDVSLVPGEEYQARIAARDRAGNTMILSSSHVLVVDTTPAAARVSDATVVDVELSSTVKSAMDLDCRPQAGTLAVPPPSVLTWVVDGDSRESVATRDVLPADVSDQYLEELCFRQGWRADDPVTVVQNSTTGVSGVCGGVAMSMSDQATVLGFSLPALRDEESGVSFVRVALGTSAGSQDLMKWSQLPVQEQRFQVVMPQLTEGELVICTVKVTNGVGMETILHSDGVRMVCAPGSLDCGYDGTFVCVV